MKSNRYTFLILVISWTCFVIGCCITAAYLEAKSQSKVKVYTSWSTEAKLIENTHISTHTDAETENFASVKSFVKRYYHFLEKGDMKNLRMMEKNPNSKDDIKKLRSYISSYDNISIIVDKVSSKDSGYLVYVSYDVKFRDIKTKLPGMSQYYVKELEDGMKIYNDMKSVSDQVKVHMQTALQKENIKQLIASVNVRYENALQKDRRLRKLIEEKQ